ncbi:MAG: hypothetical protein NT069_35565 [Planctomycetota bacterium]|nr:hypothetical protein [Planctomycetota bacterium]
MSVVITILAWRVGAIVYILTGLGSFAGIISSKETKLIPVLFRAATGGAVGAASGGWIALLIEPPEHWLLSPVTGTLVFLCCGATLAVPIALLCCFYTKVHYGTWKRPTGESARIVEIVSVSVATAMAAVLLRLM